MLKTSALVLSLAPCGTCQPHDERLPSAGVPPSQYRDKKGVRSLHELQTANVVNSGHVQFPVGQLNAKLAAAFASENKP